MSSLFAGEHYSIERAVTARREEFSTGRWLARRALSSLGVEPCPILQGESREPLWPQGYIGSITHSAGHCAVIVSKHEQFRGLGLDLEISKPPADDLAELILAPRERWRFAGTEMLRLVFSAKESVFKCVFPIHGEYIEFSDVTIEIDSDRSTFTARAHNDVSLDALVRRGQGLYERNSYGAFTLFVIPAAQPDGRIESPRPMAK
jgi:4'-phosphopantetheinyl transferase EntD